MHCLYCRKKIGLLRRLVDGEFCSAEHRVRMRSQSARALRDVGGSFTDGFDGAVTVFVKPVHNLSTKVPKHPSTANSALVFSGLIAAALIVGMLGLPEPGPAPSDAPQTGGGSLASIRSWARSYAATRINEDFRSGLGNWMPAETVQKGSRDWSYSDGFVRPGRLRLLKHSVSMSDYQVDFTSDVHKRGVGWVYRAAGPGNYYVGKLVVGSGALPTANLVRYAVLSGAEKYRATVRLPAPTRSGSAYKVHLNVKGSDFTTSVNGVVVDTWSDKTLRSGGVGFFTDPGEVATLRNVSLTDKDNFVGRVLSFLGFVRPLTLHP